MQYLFLTVHVTDFEYLYLFLHASNIKKTDKKRNKQKNCLVVPASVVAVLGVVVVLTAVVEETFATAVVVETGPTVVVAETFPTVVVAGLILI